MGLVMIMSHTDEHAREFYSGRLGYRPPCMVIESLIDMADDLIQAKEFAKSIGEQDLIGSLKQTIARCRRAIAKADREMKKACC